MGTPQRERSGPRATAPTPPTATLAVPAPSAVPPTPTPASAEAASPAAAMRLEEIERSRVFFIIVLVLTVWGIVVGLTSQGDWTAKVVLIVASSFSGASAFYVLANLLDAETYDPWRLVLPGLPVLIGAMAGVYYWGTISPVTGMLVYGIYFFGLGKDARFITMNYAIIAVSHGLLFLGIISGVLMDHGVVRMTALSRNDQVSLFAIVETLYIIAFVTARLSQRSTLRAVSKLEQAVRAVSHRDALLAEAKVELDRVRDVGGPGKYSDQVVGSYQLGMVIGRGGIGEVYEARHVRTREPAAIKLLRADALGDAVQVQRLLREAEATSRIVSRNVVRIFDVGTMPAGVPYIVMERMQGHDLAHELRVKRRLALAETLHIIEDLAAGLDGAREVGIVHRDLKPHNVFGATEGDARVWKILDFGVSKLGTTGTLTAGHVVGTPGYMSPEQARGEDVDHRADVYSLAAILYRAVTGYAAFSGQDIATTLFEVVYRIATRPSQLAELPRDVDRVLAIGLAKDKADRFATAPELARWFGDAIGEGLGPAERARADALIARAPWGSAVISAG